MFFCLFFFYIKEFTSYIYIINPPNMEYFEQQLIILKLSNTTGATCGTGIILSEHLSSHLFRVGLVLFSFLWSILSIIVFSSFFLLPMCWLSLFKLRLENTPLVSSSLYIYVPTEQLNTHMRQYENKEIEIYGEIMSWKIK
jgi:hypothetical protein